MTMKRGAAKTGGLSRRKPKADAFENLPHDASVDQLKAAAVHVSLEELEHRVADVRDSWETDSLFEELTQGSPEEQCKPFISTPTPNLFLFLFLFLFVFVFPLVSLRLVELHHLIARVFGCS